jgi:hypothetical protein
MYRTVVAACLFAAAGVAFAADAPKPPPPMRGVISQVMGDGSFEVTAKGSAVKVHLAPKGTVTSIGEAKLTDVKPGSFIGTAAVPQANGTLKALEVHVFAPSMRGTGEGFRPWEGTDGKKGTMTNGTVGSLVGSTGRTMTVDYKGGRKQVIVPDDAPIISIDPADPSIVTVGAHVIVYPLAAPKDGVTEVRSISVGKNGLDIPL